MGMWVVFGPLSFRGRFVTAGGSVVCFERRTRGMQSFRGCSRCESRGISKNVHVEGEILAQKPRRPTEIALVWRSVSDWEISSKRNPCSRALVIWNRFQISLPLWDTSVFVPELALRGVPFYEAIIGCAERCGKGGMKTLEGVFFEAESSARVSRRHFLGRLTWAHPVRCRAHAVTHVLSYACC